MSEHTDALAAQPEVEIPPARLRPAAKDISGLILEWRDWLHRRVETVALEDDRMAQRRVVVDFSYPVYNEALDRDERLLLDDERYLPIALMQKRKLGVFRVEDRAGELIPSLTRKARCQIAAKALVMLAESVVGSGNLSQPVKKELEGIVSCPAKEVERKLRKFTSARENGTSIDEKQRCKLMERKAMRDLLAAFAWNYVLLIPYPKPDQCENRQVLSYVYQEPTRRRPVDEQFRLLYYLGTRFLGLRLFGWSLKRLASRTARTLGWYPRRLWFPVPSVGHAASFHFEVRCPPGLQISDARIKVTEELPSDPYKITKAGVATLLDSSQFRDADFESGSLTLAHLYLADVPHQAWGLVSVELRPRRKPTLLHSVFIMTLLITALLLGAMPFLSNISSDKTDAAAALLLLGPSVFTAYLIVADEHPMTTNLLFGIRVLATIAGLCSFGAAAIIVASPKSIDVHVWLIPTIVSGVVTFVLAGAWLMARTRPFSNAEV
jgi:hypothetical protein